MKNDRPTNVKIEAAKQITERGYSVADGIFEKNFNPSKPKERWVSVINYVRTYKEFLYVVMVLDIFSRRIVGCSMGKHIDII